MNTETLTLCGSTRFKDTFLKVAHHLQSLGKNVLLPHTFHHSEQRNVSAEEEAQYDTQHRQRIDQSNGIYVIDVGQYIGASTRSEIEYALTHGKTVSYYSQSFGVEDQR